MNIVVGGLLLVLLALFEALGVNSTAIVETRTTLAKLADEVLDADYKADLPKLQRLHDALEPLTKDPALEPYVRYWRGFALWRRALNGFTPPMDRTAVDRDLSGAVDEFRKAIALKPDFADAQSGAAHCYMAMYAVRDRSQQAELVKEFVPLIQAAYKTAPENPRVLWVLGASQFYAPPEQGGSQDKAIETYQKGLAIARKSPRQRGSIAPTWGEAELLMALAQAHFYHATPDKAVAEKYAKDALRLVPHWHYVKEILLPAIRK